MFIYIDSYGYYTLLNFNNFIFNYHFNNKLIHNFLIYYKSNSRIASRAQKNRSNLSFSTKKLYKQKGTGRSRAGSASSPIRRKGSVCFPSFPFENFNYNLNKKYYKVVIFIIFSKLILEKKFYLIDDFFFINISTKYFYKKISNLKFKNFIFLSFRINYKFFLSQRNYFKFKLINLFKLNPILLLKYDIILLSIFSLKFLLN